ncbi:MAG: lysophospholipid acyltransferase family protein [Lachnospiraceae bacterium]|nr:lysophospholipid acyltransferase family protein [Lachnospiraceae bacterium]
MLRSLKFYAKALGSLILLTPKLKKVKKIQNNKEESFDDKYVYEIVQKWSANRVKDTGAKVFVHGRENIPSMGTVVFIGNHQSNFDFALLLAELNVPVGFIAKVELIKIPLIKDWMNLIHCLFMDRGDMKQQLKTILEGIELLKNGHSLIVFPEGTRSKDGKIGEFKAGTFKLATKAKVPIVPFTIRGAADVLENNSHYRIAPAEVHLYIHKPIDVATMDKEDLAKIHEKVQAIVEEPLR